MDAFADEFLYRVGCCFLDKARIARLGSLFSLDDFAKRTKFVELTLDPMECWPGPVLLATQKGQESHMAAHKAISTFKHNQYEDFVAEDVDWVALRAIMLRSASIPNCKVAIHLHDLVAEHIGLKAAAYSGIFKNLLTLVTETGSLVDELLFGDAYMEVEPDLDISCHLPQLTKCLRELAFRPRLWYQGNADPHRTEQCLSILRSLTQAAASTLEDVHVGCRFVDRDFHNWPTVRNLPPDLFSRCSLPWLRTLVLNYHVLPGRDLATILGSVR